MELFRRWLDNYFSNNIFFFNYIEGEKTNDKLYKSLIYGIIFYGVLLFILLIISFYKCLKDKLYQKYFEDKLKLIEDDFNGKILDQQENFNNNFSISISLLNKAFIKVHNFKKNIALIIFLMKKN
ncbi:hypothetical protein [Chryseobacterium indoltheticum]|uniref:hypothetical protein n=1 Tax=Chryseobacterium indoltheticum TaxID=254 RepID=UPI003F49A139